MTAAIPVTPVTGTDLLRTPLKIQTLTLYTLVYQNRLHEPFTRLDRFWERVKAYATVAGFGMVTTRNPAGKLAGIALGYPLPAGSHWWRGLQTEPDPLLTVETGRRTFALNEIMVLPQYHGQGYGRAMHDALLASRTEQRATLLVEEDNRRARWAYQSWGWEVFGRLQPFPEAPVYLSMVKTLKATATGGA